MNVIIDDMLVIYYDEMKDENQKKLIAEMRKSPYRNYVRRDLPEDQDVVYLMILYKRQMIEEFYHVLDLQQKCEQGKDDGVSYAGA